MDKHREHPEVVPTAHFGQVIREQPLHPSKPASLPTDSISIGGSTLPRPPLKLWGSLI